MDVKSLAKSKRAHSLHHSKKHQPNRTAKAPAAVPATAAGGEKQSGKQVKEKPGHSRGSRALPSNWDRYDEESGSGSEDTSQESTSKATDVVLPKSKGMDYAHLISEAKAQSQTACALQDFPSLDDVVDELNQGIGPLLTVRGQSILSWIEDDNFELDDKATATDKYEASFLSLDLNALAEQLAKASLSERLFVGPDILPPEMCPELYADVGLNLEQDRAKLGFEVAGGGSGSVQLNDVAEIDSSLPLRHDVASPDTTGASISSSPDGGLKSMNHVNDDLQKFRESDQGSFPESSSALDTDSVANRQPRFEAAVAEAELDMLLNSFTETKFFESTTGTEKLEGASSTPSVSSEPMKQDSCVMKSKIMASNLDDTLDELLKETSIPINTNAGSMSRGVKVVPHDIPSASNPVSKSKLLDDFDSWLNTI